MDNSEFIKIYWKELKPFVGEMISNAPLFPNKHLYVTECWEKLRLKLESYNLDDLEFRDINSKLRRQIENEILRR